MFRIFYTACLAFILGSCAVVSVQSRLERADILAKRAGFEYTEIKTGTFTLAAYYRLRPRGDIATYVEGDGFAYVSSRELSTDPTPITPTGLILAISDSADSVVYIARPCQYVKLEHEKQCSKQYWSTHRFAEEVIASYDQALDQIKASLMATGFHLVGYSGGGAVAVLLAARRDDIKSIRTVAGYLDHVALNEEIGVAPLWGSLDPMNAARSLEGIPQVHYSGEGDSVIPTWVSQNFTAAVGNPACARSVMVDRVSHESGWETFWLMESSTMPACF